MGEPTTHRQERHGQKRFLEGFGQLTQGKARQQAGLCKDSPCEALGTWAGGIGVGPAGHCCWAKSALYLSGKKVPDLFSLSHLPTPLS